MTETPVPQLFVRSDYRHAHQTLIESGFWSPLMWMTRSSPSIAIGYYYSLVGRKFWIIGSASDSHIVLPDSLISSQHALFLATADRKIYFSDLQSVHGSFINDEQVLEPVRLTQGDKIRIGSYEIEFQDSGKLSIEQPQTPSKLVVLVQSSDFQSRIWREILQTFGISVHFEHCIDQYLPNKIDGLLNTLSNFPSLIIADVENIKPNAYEFCRWCREHYPQLQIILTCSDRTKIFNSEKRWAIQQGAINFLPAFSEKSPWTDVAEVAERVDSVLQAINSPVLQQGNLEPILRALMHRSSLDSNAAQKQPNQQEP